MKKKEARLYDLIDSQDPQEILKEILYIVSLLKADSTAEHIRSVYADIILLFNGEYPGYRASNTKYHNLEHTIMVTLATARLIHGCVMGGFRFDSQSIMLGIIAGLYHDSGLIQTKHDQQGTGAKYTIGHEKRSVEFMKKNLAQKNFSKTQMKDCEHLIKCTNLSIDVRKIPFCSKELETVGKIVGSADLLGQMADRRYLEKLVLLFKEFQEAGIPDFDSEEQLLEKTEGFYKNVARKRLEQDLDNVSAYMRYHFKHRWGIDRDLYAESVKSTLKYLKSILSDGKKGKLFYEKYLKRGVSPAP